jgi:hypothetical protein
MKRDENNMTIHDGTRDMLQATGNANKSPAIEIVMSDAFSGMGSEVLVPGLSLNVPQFFTSTPQSLNHRSERTGSDTSTRSTGVNTDKRQHE